MIFMQNYNKTMMNTKISSYINFSVKAGKVIWGLDMLKNSKVKPYLIIYDKTIGQSSKKQLLKYKEDNLVKTLEVEENYLNDILKRSNVKVIGLIDESLSNAIIKLI